MWRGRRSRHRRNAEIHAKLEALGNARRLGLKRGSGGGRQQFPGDLGPHYQPAIEHRRCDHTQMLEVRPHRVALEAATGQHHRRPEGHQLFEVMIPVSDCGVKYGTDECVIADPLVKTRDQRFKLDFIDFGHRAVRLSGYRERRPFAAQPMFLFQGDHILVCKREQEKALCHGMLAESAGDDRYLAGFANNSELGPFDPVIDVTRLVGAMVDVTDDLVKSIKHQWFAKQACSRHLIEHALSRGGIRVGANEQNSNQSAACSNVLIRPPS